MEENKKTKNAKTQIKKDDNVQLCDIESVFEELKLLGKSLDENKFSKDHKITLDLLIEGIKKLNEERRSLREELEVVTITNSRKRQSLYEIPKLHEKNFNESVLKLRKKYSEEYNQKHQQLELCLTETNQTEINFNQIQAENEKLELQSKQAKKETTEQLNAHLIEKSEQGILLNETKDAHHESTNQTEEYKLGRVLLADHLKNYLKNNKKEQEELKEEIVELEKEAETEGKEKLRLKTINDRVSEELFEAKIQKDTELDKIEKLKRGSVALNDEKKTLDGKISTLTDENECLCNERESATKDFENLVTDFERKIKRAKSNLSDVMENKQKGHELTGSLKEQQKCSIARGDELAELSEKLKTLLKEKTENANDFKTTLDDLEEELEKTTVKNKKLMIKRKSKAEKHEDFMDEINDDIEDLQRELIEKKYDKERIVIENDKVSKQLRSYIDELHDSNEILAGKIEQLKEGCKNSLDRTHELNRESRLNRRKNEESSKSLEIFQKESIREREEWLMEIERLLDEVDTNKTELSRNSLKKQENLGKVVELRKKHKHLSELYEKVKQDLVSLRKDEKLKVGSIKQTRELILEKSESIQSSKDLLKEANMQSSEQLTYCQNEVKECDIKIYNQMNLQYKINKENILLVKNTKKIMLNSEQLRKISNEDVPKILKELKKQSLSYQDELRNSYQKHLCMDNFYNEKDGHTMNKLKAENLFTAERVRETEEILVKMNFLNDDYSNFINKIQSCRPTSN